MKRFSILLVLVPLGCAGGRSAVNYDYLSDAQLDLSRLRRMESVSWLEITSDGWIRSALGPLGNVIQCQSPEQSEQSGTLEHALACYFDILGTQALMSGASTFVPLTLYCASDRSMADVALVLSVAANHKRNVFRFALATEGQKSRAKLTAIPDWNVLHGAIVGFSRIVQVIPSERDDQQSGFLWDAHAADSLSDLPSKVALKGVSRDCLREWLVSLSADQIVLFPGWQSSAGEMIIDYYLLVRSLPVVCTVNLWHDAEDFKNHSQQIMPPPAD